MLRCNQLSVVMALLATCLLQVSGPTSASACYYGSASLRYSTLLRAGHLEAAQKIVDRMRQRGEKELTLLLAEQETLKIELVNVSEEADIVRLQERLSLLEQLIDAVGGQRYCTASRLFWYTDLDQARQASLETGKPILSLRMLGKLTDELSCANSRFFRTTLYSNTEISQRLREQFVLHWESVRPIPVVTVDFGDGRKMVRTLTGNSAHYLLDSQGRAIDVLPGLYSPQAFITWIDRIAPLGREVMAQPDQREALIANYHQQSLVRLQQEWEAELLAVSAVTTAEQVTQAVNRMNTTNGQVQATAAVAVPAVVAARRAGGKGMVEIKPLRALAIYTAPTMETADDELWRSIAANHQQEVQFDESSVALIGGENPTAVDAGVISFAKMDTEGPLLAKLFARLQSNIALDTVKNEYQLHRQIHEWFTNGESGNDLASLNERVYAELFLTPSSDPWLGLVERDVYTGLTDAGVVHATTRTDGDAPPQE